MNIVIFKCVFVGTFMGVLTSKAGLSPVDWQYWMFLVPMLIVTSLPNKIGESE